MRAAAAARVMMHIGCAPSSKSAEPPTESVHHKAQAPVSLTLTQAPSLSGHWVTAIASPSIDAPLLHTHEEVMRAATEYFRDPAYVGRGVSGFDPAYVGRGVSGFDLVDWLDGWFWLKGTDDCSSMRMLVRNVFGFPYDFAACP